MKIVHVGNHFSPCIGGVEKVMMDTCRLLNAGGHEAWVVCLERCANSKARLPKQSTENGVRVRRVPFLDLHYYKIALGVLSEIKSADIVHVHGIGFFSDFLIATKWLHKKPIVVSTHGGIFHTESIGFLKKIYFHAIQRMLLGFADAIIAVSRNDLQLFKKIVKHAALIENGVNISDFRAGTKKPGSFLFLGRFSKNKRIDLLLETFAAVARIAPKANKGKFSLIIAGTDWEGLLNEYKKRAKELGLENSVEFVLDPDEVRVRELYSESEYYVSASRYEGFGISLVEAMASGCVPIVEKNMGYSEIVDDKENGFFAYFEDSEDAAKKIVAVLNMAAAEKKKVSRKAVSKAGKFSLAGKMEKTEMVYRRLLAK
ncbi:MAG: glycosyltransferase family 4 protein [archaeon]|nr:glycosyltransferase family 4 protein [archaeon]